ncbi:MAG: Crp/Fnr family transcriptional regulator [Pseudomonadota bacterium]
MLSAISCDTCAIRHRALCGVLSAEEIQKINAIAFRRTFAPNEMILNDRETPEFFGNIISGVVKLSKMMADGRQQIVGLQFASDFIGRPFATRNPFFAEAASEVVLCCFRKKQFEDLVREMPDLEHRMFQHTLDELDAARAWMVLLGRKSAEERIASFINLVVERAQASSGCRSDFMADSGAANLRIELPLTRAEIADYLGLTIETVSRQFTRLKSRGIIDTAKGRQILVHDVGVLRDVAGEEDPVNLGID